MCCSEGLHNAAVCFQPRTLKYEREIFCKHVKQLMSWLSQKLIKKFFTLLNFSSACTQNCH